MAGEKGNQPYIQTIQAPNKKIRKDLYEISMKASDHIVSSIEENRNRISEVVDGLKGIGLAAESIDDEVNHLNQKSSEKSTAACVMDDILNQFSHIVNED